MPKVTYFTATSLDGYIADENSSLDWLFETPHGDDETSWERLMAESAALVMGGTTYRWMIDHDPEMLTGPEKWREYYAERPVWVFTHATDLPEVQGTQVRFVQGDVKPVYDEIAATVDGGIWLVGGGDLVGTLGAGAPLLPRRITSKRMRVIDVMQTGEQVQIRYRIARH
jgi:dihydrofolate reductase